MNIITMQRAAVAYRALVAATGDYNNAMALERKGLVVPHHVGPFMYTLDSAQDAYAAAYAELSAADAAQHCA